LLRIEAQVKLAVSNIAWAPEERLAAYDLLHQRGIRGLEFAPGLLFGPSYPFDPSQEDVQRVRGEIESAGLRLVSMQALLYGMPGAELFGNAGARALFIRGMERSIALAGRLGVPNLVFGSPAQRILPSGMSVAEGMESAVPVFRELAEVAARVGTKVAIEFNPKAYGGNFITHLVDAERFVERISHPAVALLLDLGGMHLNHEFESIDIAISRILLRLSHVHVSEPFLAPAPADPDAAALALKALRTAGYEGWISIEMKRPKVAALAEIKSAIGRLLTAVEVATK